MKVVNISVPKVTTLSLDLYPNEITNLRKEIELLNSTYQYDYIRTLLRHILDAANG